MTFVQKYNGSWSLESTYSINIYMYVPETIAIITLVHTLSVIIRDHKMLPGYLPFMLLYIAPWEVHCFD